MCGGENLITMWIIGAQVSVFRASALSAATPATIDKVE